MSDDRETRLRRALERKLNPSELSIVDQSHLHAGHSGARDGRSHFKIRVVSEVFEGVARARRHQMVYEAVGELMTTDIHALSIQTKTPLEAQVSSV